MLTYQRTLDRFGLSPDVAMADIESQWRSHAKRWHPDRNGNSTEAHLRFIELRNQYDYLKKHFKSYQQHREATAKETERAAQKRAEEVARATAQRAKEQADSVGPRSSADSKHQPHGSSRAAGKNFWDHKPSEKEPGSGGQTKTSDSNLKSKAKRRLSPALVGVLAACISLIFLNVFGSLGSVERPAKHTTKIESLFSDVERTFPKRVADRKAPKRSKMTPTPKRNANGDGNAVAAMDAYWSAFYRCLQDPETDIPRSGSLEIALKIENHEITELMFQKDRLGNKAVRACFIETARSLRFPSLEGTHRIVYPFEIILEKFDSNPSV